MPTLSTPLDVAGMKSLMGYVTSQTRQSELVLPLQEKQLTSQQNPMTRLEEICKGAAHEVQEDTVPGLLHVKHGMAQAWHKLF